MDAELLARAKREEVEREVAEMRLIAAARRAEASAQESTSQAPKAVPVIRWRLLRALGLVS